MGSTSYGPEIDIWATACIFVEVTTRKNFIRANDEQGQLEMIKKFFGISPTTQAPFSNAKIQSFTNCFDEEGYDLVMRMFSYSPKDRPTARQCLDHPYFTKHPDLPSLRFSFPDVHGFEALNREKEIRLQHPSYRGGHWRGGRNDWFHTDPHSTNSHWGGGRGGDWQSHPESRNPDWGRGGRWRGNRKPWRYNRKRQYSPPEILEDPSKSPRNRKQVVKKSISYDPMLQPLFKGFSEPLSVELFGLTSSSTMAMIRPFFHDAHTLALQNKAKGIIKVNNLIN